MNELDLSLEPANRVVDYLDDEVWRHPSLHIAVARQDVRDHLVELRFPLYKIEVDLLGAALRTAGYELEVKQSGDWQELYTVTRIAPLKEAL